jgi:predicted kinase
MKAIVLRGIPGSGKSTLTKTFGKATVCSADNAFMKDGEYKFDISELGNAHASCLRAFIEACQRQEELVVVDNTNTMVVEMAPYVSVAMAYGYEVEIIFCKVSAKTSKERNVHGVPGKTIESMERRIQSSFPFHWPKEKIIEND